MNEIHPYNDYSSIPEGTRLLIVGTAPPLRFSKPRPSHWRELPEDVDFYYGSKDNLLWKEIFPNLYQELLPFGIETVADDRRSFLKKHKFWMHDICQEYTRTGPGALDSNLVVLVHADLRRILEEHETIDTLVFTGAAAEAWSGKKMEMQKLIRPYQFGAGGISRRPMPRMRSLAVVVSQRVRTIQTVTVPSPSPLAMRSYSLQQVIDRLSIGVEL